MPRSSRKQSKGPSALPSTLRHFLSYIARETRVPVEYVSFGPLREETVWMGRGASPHPVGSLTPWAD